MRIFVIVLALVALSTAIHVGDPICPDAGWLWHEDEASNLNTLVECCRKVSDSCQVELNGKSNLILLLKESIKATGWNHVGIRTLYNQPTGKYVEFNVFVRTLIAGSYVLPRELYDFALLENVEPGVGALFQGRSVGTHVRTLLQDVSPPSVPISNYLVYSGMRYATLDNTAPSATDIGCQTSALSLPDGWSVAPDTAQTRAVILAARWGTVCLVTASGRSYAARTTDQCGDAQLLNVNGGYNVLQCARRVLITQPAADGEVDQMSAVPAVTQMITVGGIAYATIDSADAASAVQGCQVMPRKLPDGWSIAPNNNATRAAIMGQAYQFGTTCLVLADGTSVNSASSDVCASDQLQTVDDVFMARWCNSRVLISRSVSDIPVPDPFVNVVTYSWQEQVSAITQYMHTTTLAFATMDDSVASSWDGGCHNKPMRLPAGWRLAQESEVPANVLQMPWATHCLVFANGVARDHAGGLCGTNQLLQYGDMYSARWCDIRVMITRDYTAETLNAASFLQLRVLLLSRTGDESVEAQLPIARQTLQAHGIPFDEYCLSVTAASPVGCLTGALAPLLSCDSAARPVCGNYQALVFTTAQLSYTAASTGWVQINALPDTHWYTVLEYSARFGARVVALTGEASNAPGTDVYSGIETTWAAHTLTFADAGFDAKFGLRADMQLPLDSGIPQHPLIVTDASLVTPVLQYVTDPAGSTQTPNGVYGAVIVTYMNGAQQLLFGLEHPVWAMHSVVLGQLWAQWCTHGVYVGQRRVMLSTQIDDFFLSTVTWSPTANGPGTVPFRASPEDLQGLADAITVVNTMLPAGSTWRPEICLNGFPIVNKNFGGFDSDPLWHASRRLYDKFFWESHSYSHLILNYVTYDQALADVLQNVLVAGEFLRGKSLDNWSAFSEVTPGISGLLNGEALHALHDAGIRYVVGDNSIPTYVPQNRYHGLWTNVQTNGYAGVFIVPRFPTYVYFDCSLPEEDLAEYRHIYSLPSDMDTVLRGNALDVAKNLMSFRHDPYMFHQPNIRLFDWPHPVTGSTQKFSLLSLWTAHVAAQYTRFSTLPVLTVKHDTMGDMLLDRMARDACGASVFVARNAVGMPLAALVDSPGSTSCHLAVTGVNLASDPRIHRVETYGTWDKTTWIDIRKTEQQTEAVLAFS